MLSTSDGMFQELLLWAAYSFVLLAFMLRWRARTLVAITVAGLTVLGALNEIKRDYRLQLEENSSLSMDERLDALGQRVREPDDCAAGALQRPIALALPRAREPGVDHIAHNVLDPNSRAVRARRNTD